MNICISNEARAALAHAPCLVQHPGSDVIVHVVQNGRQKEHIPIVARGRHLSSINPMGLFEAGATPCGACGLPPCAILHCLGVMTPNAASVIRCSPGRRHRWATQVPQTEAAFLRPEESAIAHDGVP
jgi:hypothetical protein